MKSTPLAKSILFASVLTLASWGTASAKDMRTISRAQLLDKIRGGWAGQMIGVAYGGPTEFRSNGKILDWDLKWDPASINTTLDQDDLYVEMTFARVMDTVGLDATTEQYGEAFKTSQYRLWHANAAGRRALAHGIKAPWSGHPKYNSHANDIDFQIEADFIGLMCPGLPREVNRFCDRVGRVMNYGDGLYGGMFVCGMYSAAFFENDPRKVVEAGLACIPAKSEYGLLIRDLLDWSARHPQDWRKVWQLVQDKWDKHDPCPDGAMVPFNIDAKINGAYIAFGLLFGGGDFLKTMEISTRCGQDSDCNPSSAAGVLGVILGFKGIPDQFTSAIPALEDKKFSFTDYSFNQIVTSTEARALKLIRKAGGKIDDQNVQVPVQKAKAPRLEQWDPGMPLRRIKATDAGWTYKGDWKNERDTKVASAPGDEAVLEFEGTGVLVMAQLSQNGGRADVFLDNRKLDFADAWIPERTSDNSLWHRFELKPGKHTLRLVTRGDAHPQSKGKRLALLGAVSYGPKE